MRENCIFTYAAVTLYGRPFQTVRLTLSYPSFKPSFQLSADSCQPIADSLIYCGPATPGSPCESPGLGSSDFARHYFRNHGCFLFLWVLRWFTSPGSLDHPMNSDERNRCSHRLGFPIRKSPDHSLLAATRSLSQLTTSFIAYLCQGIHTHALSSLTIKSTINTKCRFLILLRLFQRPSNNNMATTGTALLVVSNARQSYSIFKDQKQLSASSFQLSAMGPQL